MLAITQHNQQMVVKNANLEQLTEEENVGQTSRDVGQTSRDEPKMVIINEDRQSQNESEARPKEFRP